MGGEQKEKTWDTLAEIIQKADIEDDMEYLIIEGFCCLHVVRKGCHYKANE